MRGSMTSLYSINRKSKIHTNNINLLRNKIPRLNLAKIQFSSKKHKINMIFINRFPF